MEGFARQAGLLARGLHAFPALGRARSLAASVEKSPGGAFRGSARPAAGFDHGARASARGWRAKKNGGDQALGRSRGGFSTKIRAATLDENSRPFGQPPLVPSAASAVALHLTPGQAHAGRQFETRYESLDTENVLEFAALDKGYAADRIRARLARDGIEPVIPPISSRCQKLPSNKELYRGRNRVERFFNKLQQFRRLATRDDKLAKTFCAALHLGAAFLILRNS